MFYIRLSVRRFVEGKICPKFALLFCLVHIKKTFIFNLLCVLICNAKRKIHKHTKTSRVLPFWHRCFALHVPELAAADQPHCPVLEFPHTDPGAGTASAAVGQSPHPCPSLWKQCTLTYKSLEWGELCHLCHAATQMLHTHTHTFWDSEPKRGK